MRALSLVSLLTLVVAGVLSSPAAADYRYPYNYGYYRANDLAYKIRIVNLTPGQTFTPIYVSTHTASTPLFSVGQPASFGLESLAEGGNPADLVEQESDRSGVFDIRTTAELSSPTTPPGGTATLYVRTNSKNRYVSVAAMLIPTNDTFMALNNSKGPTRIGQSVSFRVPGYDAGGEINDELCINIPGPQCAEINGGTPGEGFNAEEGGEGFVHIQNGIHGQSGQEEPGGPSRGLSDLQSSRFTWLNPVADIRVELVRIRGELPPPTITAPPEDTRPTAGDGSPVPE